MVEAVPSISIVPQRNLLRKQQTPKILAIDSKERVHHIRLILYAAHEQRMYPNFQTNGSCLIYGLIRILIAYA